jgi:endonuclease/exonuclease/phosphatase family metal-dependent hydrolase
LHHGRGDEARDSLSAAVLLERLRLGGEGEGAAPLRGAFGNGLLIVSRLPLKGDGLRAEDAAWAGRRGWEAAAPHREPRLYNFNDYTRADEFAVSKGGLHAEICVSGLGWVDFYTAHFGAVSFDPESGDYVASQRASQLDQARELASWISRSRVNPLMILAVDTNADPLRWDPARAAYVTELSPVYRLLTGPGPDELGLTDTFAAANALTPERLARERVSTFERRNPYVSAGAFSSIPDELIDFVLVSGGQERLVPVRSVLFLTAPRQLSDHSGVLTTFRVTPSRQTWGLCPQR